MAQAHNKRWMKHIESGSLISVKEQTETQNKVSEVIVTPETEREREIGTGNSEEQRTQISMARN